MLSTRTLLIGIIFVPLLFLSAEVSGQDIMMQGWFWDYPKPTNPNGDPNTEQTWAKTLETQAAALGAAGFTYLWLPPASRASFGHLSNGYDPKDLYDLGEFGQGATGFGFRQDVDALITALSAAGVEAIADVVYNHRDGGLPEHNPAVQEYITLAYGNPDFENPFPSDRFRVVLPLGGSSGNGAGDYFIKIRSQTEHSRFYGKPYVLYLETGQVGWQGLSALTESEPNGGGDCGQTYNTTELGRDMQATIDNSGCKIDEFLITLQPGDFDSAGDFLYIYLTNPNGDYSDHRPVGIWNGSAGQDVAGQLEYQTYTDFTSLPSGRGGMNYAAFRPSSPGNAYGETLAGDWNSMLFFYDYDQSAAVTRDSLFAWSKWLWDDVGIRGFRMDAVKHFDYAFVGDLLDYLHAQGINPGMAVGEFFDTNAGSLENWVDNVEGSMDAATLAATDVRVFDFALRQSLKDACDAFGYDVRNVFQSGMVDGVGSNPFNVVTFINNHDYRYAGQPVQNDPMLAYAYILTNNKVGLPCVFYPDYYGVDLTPEYPLVNLKDEIDQLIQLHKDYIFQSASWDYLSRFSTPYNAFYVSGFPNTTLVYQMSGGIGGAEVIVAINFAGVDLDVYHQIHTSNTPPGTIYTEMTGNGLQVLDTVNGNNEIRFRLPARSYGVWVEGTLILPAELTDFMTEKEGMDARLQWRTAAEVDFSHFVVQRSTDGDTFTEIGRVPATGSNSNYDFLDPAPGTGTFYYRLVLTDQDGSIRFSPVRSLQFGSEEQSLRWYPNPVGQEGTLEITSELPTTLGWRLVDIRGVEVRTGETGVNPGLNRVPITLGELPAGVYLLEVSLAATPPMVIRLMVQ